MAILDDTPKYRSGHSVLWTVHHELPFGLPKVVFDMRGVWGGLTSKNNSQALSSSLVFTAFPQSVPSDDTVALDIHPAASTRFCILLEPINDHSCRWTLVFNVDMRGYNSLKALENDERTIRERPAF